MNLDRDRRWTTVLLSGLLPTLLGTGGGCETAASNGTAARGRRIATKPDFEQIVRHSLGARAASSTPIELREGVGHLRGGRLDAELRSDPDAPVIITDPGRMEGWISLASEDRVAAAVSDSKHAMRWATSEPTIDEWVIGVGDSIEHARVVRTARRVADWSIAIDHGPAVAHLDVDRVGRLIARDIHGRVVLFASAPVAIDARGARRKIETSLSTIGGRTRWTLHADLSDLVAPIVLDPSWSSIAPAPLARQGMGTAAFVDGTIVFAGGYTSDGGAPAGGAFSFVPSASGGTFATVNDDDGSTGYGDAVTAAFRLTTGDLFFVQGVNDGAIYRESGSKWTSVDGSLGYPALQTTASAQLMDGRVVVTGGYNGNTNSALSVGEIYDPSSGWSADTILQVPRYSANLVAIGNSADELLLVSGADTHQVAISTVEIFAPSSNVWTLTAPLSIVRYGLATAALGNGKVLAAGGNDSSGDDVASCEIFDRATSGWTATGSMAESRSQGSWATLPDGRVMVAGGFNDNIAEGIVSTVELYDPDAGTWSESAPMIQERAGAMISVLGDGGVLIVGGTLRDNQSQMLSTAEIWTAGPGVVGDSCGVGSDCPTGTCVGGICCETACAGACMSCSVQGSLGACVPDPSCVDGGIPDASDASIAEASTPDSATPDASLTDAMVDTVTASDAESTDAGPEVSTLDASTADAPAVDSTAPETSSTETSTPEAGRPEASTPETPTLDGAADSGKPTLIGNFQACSSASDCGSGFCVDGVCCNSACTDPCHSCVLPGSPGVCAEEPIGVDLNHDCSEGLSCLSTCGPAGTCIGAGAGTTCAPSTCTGPSTGKGAAQCAANGSNCPESAAIAFDCSPYVCESAFGACSTECTTSSACADGFVCDTDHRVCIAPVANGASGCGCNFASHETSSMEGLGVIAAVGILARRRNRRGR